MSPVTGAIAMDVFPGQPVLVALRERWVPAIVVGNARDGTAQPQMEGHLPERVMELALGFHSRESRLLQVVPLDRISLWNRRDAYTTHTLIASMVHPFILARTHHRHNRQL